MSGRFPKLSFRRKNSRENNENAKLSSGNFFPAHNVKAAQPSTGKKNGPSGTLPATPRASMARRMLALFLVGLLVMGLVCLGLWWAVRQQAAYQMKQHLLSNAGGAVQVLNQPSSVKRAGNGLILAPKTARKLQGISERFTSPIGGYVGIAVFDGSHPLWASVTLRTNHLPPPPQKNDVARWWPGGQSWPEGASGGLALFSIGQPWQKNNVHRLSIPVLAHASEKLKTANTKKRGSGKKSDDSHLLTLLIVENNPTSDAHLLGARHAIWVAFGLSFVALALTELIGLRWALHPVRRLTGDLRDLRAGTKSRLDERRRPVELAPMVRLFNQVLEHESRAAERHRRDLDGLSHALKTPLSVLTTLLSELDSTTEQDSLSGNSEDMMGGAARSRHIVKNEKIKEPRQEPSSNDEKTRQRLIHQQIHVINTLIHRHLSTAAVVAGASFSARTPLLPLANPLAEGLEKLHRDRGVFCEFLFDEETEIPLDEVEANEVLGNLMDNAFKWARSKVVLDVKKTEKPSLPSPWWRFWSTHPAPELMLDISVEDDGPGVPVAERDAIWHRGIRVDERVEGHGVGLSLVAEVAFMKSGDAWVEESAELGGARFVVRLPWRAGASSSRRGQKSSPS